MKNQDSPKIKWNKQIDFQLKYGFGLKLENNFHAKKVRHIRKKIFFPIKERQSGATRFGNKNTTVLAVNGGEHILLIQ